MSIAALTTYVVQTLIGLCAFYGVGLGFGGQTDLWRAPSPRLPSFHFSACRRCCDISTSARWIGFSGAQSTASR